MHVTRVSWQRARCCASSGAAAPAPLQQPERARDPRSPPSASRSRRPRSRSTRAKRSSSGSRATTPRTASASSAPTTNVVDPEARQGRGQSSSCAATTPGRYTFECTRMCGAGHNFMRGVLIVARARHGVGAPMTRRCALAVAALVLAARCSCRRWRARPGRAASARRSAARASRRRSSTSSASGLDDFTEVETAEEGLGPAFNGTSCAVCHNVPAIGGAGVIARGARRLPRRRRRVRGAERRRRHAVPHVLDPDPRLPAA